jgi:hypothetical protein
VLRQASSLWLLLSIACSESHAPPPHTVAACQGAGCIDAGHFADGGIRTSDAALSTNIIDQVDAATPRDAGAPTCDEGACSGYRVRGGFVSSSDRSLGALRVSDQRISGIRRSCADVHGTQLCVRGGLR